MTSASKTSASKASMGTTCLADPPSALPLPLLLQGAPHIREIFGRMVGACLDAPLLLALADR